jgi:hypothetical protein
MDETIKLADALAIVQREKAQWDSQPGDNDQLAAISIGGSGACANIAAALLGFDVHQPPQTEPGKDGAA